MNVARMRWLDRWIGVPVCLLLTCWRRLRSIFAATSETGQFKSILFVKLAEQGSTVLAYPAMRSAVERVGRDHVYFLAFEENRAIVDLLDVIPRQNVLTIRTGNLVTTVLGALKVLWRMRRIGVEAAIDLEFFARSSAALTYLSGARQRAGFHAFGGEASYRGDLMTHRLSFNPYLHTSQTFRSLLDAFDVPASQLPAFPRTIEKLESPPLMKPSADEIDRVERMAGLTSDDGPLFLLNANASDLLPLRKWSSDHYTELANRLLNRFATCRIAFTGAPSEAPAVERMVGRIGSERCTSLAGKTTLRELLVLYSLAEVLVTNDSGPAHFATLTSIDVVVLFGPETPQLFAAVSPRTHPLWAGLSCSPCINAFNNRVSPCRDNLCMKALDVNQVFAAVCQCYGERHALSRRLPLAS